MTSSSLGHIKSYNEKQLFSVSCCTHTVHKNHNPIMFQYSYNYYFYFGLKWYK